MKINVLKKKKLNQATQQVKLCNNYHTSLSDSCWIFFLESEGGRDRGVQMNFERQSKAIKDSWANMKKTDADKQIFSKCRNLLL